jgi:hypothetical protein
MKTDEPADRQASADLQSTEVLLAGSGFLPLTIRRLTEYLASIATEGYGYPWDGLEDAVAHFPAHRLLLVGYGSLLNQDSAAKTIKARPAGGHPPVLALGARRVFNYVIPAAKLKAYGGTFGPREHAALNVDYTQSAANALNGRLIGVPTVDIPPLRAREFGYDLRPVACLPWNDKDAKPFTAFVLVAVKPARNGRQVLDDEALPHPSYYRVCREGARAVSEAFLQLYLQTTYLADRKTTLVEWEHAHPEILDEQ